MNSLYIQGIHLDWNAVEHSSYLHGVPSLKGLCDLSFQRNITFFAGENGTGKSTLLEAMAVAYGFNPEGGTLNYRFSTFEDVSELHRALRITKGFRRPAFGYFFRAESFFTVASKTEEYRDSTSKEIYYARYGGKSFHEQSHGESFLSAFLSFNQKGLYFMDEPEAALSPQKQLTLFIHITRMAREGSQFFIATHSPILLGIPESEILSFDGGIIKPCPYEETESFQITEMFINCRETLVKRLLEED